MLVKWKLTYLRPVFKLISTRWRSRAGQSETIENSFQNLEAKSKAKKGKSQLSVDGKSLNEKTSSKSIKSKESKNSIKLEKKESRKKHKERNPR